MKGYFSQLVRRTGLTFGPGRAPAPGSFPAAPSGTARDNPRAGLTRLDVEEVVFTSSSRGAGVEDPRSGGQDPGRPGAASVAYPPYEKTVDAGGRAEAGRKNPGGVVELSSGTRGVQYETREVKGEPLLQGGAEGQSRTGPWGPRAPGEELQRGRRSGRLDGSEKIDTAEIRAEVRGHPVLRQGPPEGDRPTPPVGLEDQRTLQGAREAGPLKTVLGEPDEKEAAFAAYLQEIRAWVAVTPDNDGREPGQEGRVRAAPPEESGGELTLERDENTAVAAAAFRTQDPGSQDLTVSIGTISVVIEESAREAPAPPAIPFGIDGRRTEPAPGESTSLSRYYLRKW